MEMIQNVVMQEAAPAVLPQSGRSAAAPGAQLGASFADLLQGREVTLAEAAQAADQGGAPAAPGVPVRLNLGAVAENGAQGTAAVDPTAGLLAGPDLAQLVLLNAGLAGAAQQSAQPEGMLESAAVQQPARPTEKSMQQVPESDRQEVADATPEVPVDAQLLAAMAAAAQQVMAPLPEARVQELGSVTRQEIDGVTQPTEVTGRGAAQAGAGPAVAAAVIPQPAATGTGAPQAAQLAGAAVQPAPLGNPALSDAGRQEILAQTADQSVPTQVHHGGEASQPGQPALQVVPAPSTDARALDALQAAASEAHSNALRDADRQGAALPSASAQQPQVTGENRQAAVLPQANNPQQSSAQSGAQAGAAAEVIPFPDRSASATGSKGTRAAGFYGTYSELRGVTERAGTTQQASLESAESAESTESADSAVSAAPAVRLAAAREFFGQHGSGEQEHKGEPQHKSVAGDAAAAQLQTSGAKTETLEVPAEAKPVHTRSALHESILSQVRDGVVTHDGKGNGQMSIRLNPGELGELKIQVRMEDNRIRVEVQADNKMVKDLLMGNLESLKDSLTSKNFTMEGFDVSTGGGSNNPLNEQHGNPQQQSSRTARAGGYGAQAEETRVNYLTEEVNGLLDVSF